MKKALLIITTLLFLFVGCEKRTEPDTTPPTVTITNPQTGTTVYEYAIINCVAIDNDKIDKVVLWVDGDATTSIDETEPYSLIWDTTIYEDESSHTITIRAYDESNNKTDSDPINLTVDNTQSYPTAVDLLSVLYQEESFLIFWTKNYDEDFLSYSLYESLSEDMSDETLITQTVVSSDTTWIVNGITENERRYYQVTVTDTCNLQTASNIMSGGNFLKISYVAYADGDGNVCTIDIDGNNITQLTSNTSDMDPIWKPDGNKIIFSRDLDFMLRDIFQIDLDGNNEINLTNNQGYDEDMKISGDGERIVFFSWGDYPKDIYIMNSDGSGRTNLTNDETWDGDPDISLDGQKIAWTSRRTGINEIFIMNSDGSNQIQLTNNLNGTESSDPIFSPDGTQIIFINNNDIYYINSEGGDATNLTNVGSWVTDYSFSSDGLKIIFSSDPDNNNSYDIFIMNSDGSNLTNLTNGFGNSSCPDISEDNQQIVFCSKVDEYYDIYIMDIDGNDRVQLTNTNFNDYSTKFQPQH